ncbi:MAG: sugar phosphate isomerase/epimerase family protein, partial [Halobacteria archaeon]
MLSRLVTGFKVRWKPEDLDKFLEYNPAGIEIQEYREDLDAAWEAQQRHLTSTLAGKQLLLAIHHPGAVNEDVFDPLSPKHAVREEARRQITQCLELAYKLQTYSADGKVILVAHPGGLSESIRTDSSKLRASLVDMLLNLLEAKKRVIIALENMPVLYRFRSNILVANVGTTPNSLIQIFDEVRDPRLNLCFDLCHAQLARNYLKSFHIRDFIEQLGDKIVQIHLADAKGPNIEGLPIGAGEIDFRSALELLIEYAHGRDRILVVPEIANGHLES